MFYLRTMGSPNRQPFYMEIWNTTHPHQFLSTHYIHIVLVFQFTLYQIWHGLSGRRHSQKPLAPMHVAKLNDKNTSNRLTSFDQCATKQMNQLYSFTCTRLKSQDNNSLETLSCSSSFKNPYSCIVKPFFFCLNII